jgi:hypothetical protein
VNRLLTFFPAVIFLGVRQGRKTTLTKKLRPGGKYIDLEQVSNYDLVSRDFDFFSRKTRRKGIFRDSGLLHFLQKIRDNEQLMV